MAKLTAYGGAGSTTGANFLLEIGDKKILVDCGMEQGGEKAHEHNKKKFAYEPSEVEMLFVTHAHIDHIGLIPKLVKEGFKGEIYSTAETRKLAELLLADALKIARGNQEMLYSVSDVSTALSFWKTLDYHKLRDFGEFTLELYNAGHILGSSMFKFTLKSGLPAQAGKSMLFTGDIGNSPSLLLPDVEKVSGLDYLLMESVYGDRNHEHKELREEKFKRVVAEAIARRGTLLIPAFSLERTQEILAKLDNLFESKEIPAVPVYLDSPLALKITAIYEQAGKLFNREAQTELEDGDDLFRFKNLHEINNLNESHAIAGVNGAKIIIAGSGMSTAGRIVGHEERYLPDPRSTILFMGFQAAGTLGRQIKEGIKKVVIDGQIVEVRAKVENIDGFSGHADSNALVDFVFASEKSLKKVYVAMGEPRSSIFLAQRLKDELGLDAVVTEEGKSYEIEL
jgi:metallo-beta-lactamase family protein